MSNKSAVTQEYEPYKSKAMNLDKQEGEQHGPEDMAVNESEGELSIVPSAVGWNVGSSVMDDAREKGSRAAQ